MYRKLLVSISLIIAFIFSFTFCFAADGNNGLKNAADGVRNVVGGAENAIENAAKDISNTSRNVTGDMENGANNIGNNTKNMTDTTGTTTNTNMHEGNYSATRTATTGNNATFMGMSATAWTWLIIGIAAIAIVALVWYYSTQMRSSNYDDRD